jgi:hypothetical protein
MIEGLLEKCRVSFESRDAVTEEGTVRAEDLAIKEGPENISRGGKERQQPE